MTYTFYIIQEKVPASRLIEEFESVLGQRVGHLCLSYYSKMSNIIETGNLLF